MLKGKRAHKRVVPDGQLSVGLLGGQRVMPYRQALLDRTAFAGTEHGTTVRGEKLSWRDGVRCRVVS